MNDALAAPTAVLGALTLEVALGSTPAHAALGHTDASALAETIAMDLAKLVPEVRALDLVLGAAHFDPAEALRPGWPLHRRLQELHARAPRGEGPRIMVFGADAQGVVPQPLRAEPALHGGPLRVVPFALIGAGEAAAIVAARFEADLLEHGMAGAATALQAQDGFRARVEHARYLTILDLAAMIAAQYQHVGLQHLWPLIETALIAPQREAWLDAAPEPLLHYADGSVRMAQLDFDTWRRQAPAETESERSEAADTQARRRFGHIQARLQQYRAVLEAHGIAVMPVAVAAGDDPRTRLQASAQTERA